MTPARFIRARLESGTLYQRPLPKEFVALAEAILEMHETCERFGDEPRPSAVVLKLAAIWSAHPDYRGGVGVVSWHGAPDRVLGAPGPDPGR